MTIGTVGLMPESVKRRYHSRVRGEQATATRQAVLRSAREHFTTHGYAATGVADIAAAAGVNVDTVYASVGRKPQLMLAVSTWRWVIERPVSAEERGYVRAIRAAWLPRPVGSSSSTPGARTHHAAGGALFDALGQAALADPECAQLRDHLAQRRRDNMTLFAADLRSTGHAARRPSDETWPTGLGDQRTGILSRITAQDWTPERYVALLTDMWIRTLLRTPER